VIITHTPRITLGLVLTLGLAACDEFEMSEEWQLDRLRVLGVRAEVIGGPDPVLGYRAEPRPGETTGFSSLIYVPDDQEWESTTWLACLPEDSDLYGCSPNPEALEAFEALDEDQLDFKDPDVLEELLELARAAGLIGIEPFYEPLWEVPIDALYDQSEAERQEGKSAFLTLAVAPVGAEDDADLELAFKQVPVSEAVTPNHNPDIIDIEVAGQSLGDDVGFTARRGITYKLNPVLAPHHIETYAYLREDGETEWRAEQPYFTWYAEAGEFDEPLSLHPFSKVEWKAPNKTGVVTLYTVVRDRRGGMGWRRVLVKVL
jgi:hypothetical protein